ncbi:MAG: hypothetical protein V1699_00200, partial [Candidatus Omnitrophota bacterium]
IIVSAFLILSYPLEINRIRMLYFGIKQKADKMRDMVFKNLVSGQKKRRIISSSEISEDRGVRSTIHRHFVYVIKEIDKAKTLDKPLPYLYVLKTRNSKERKEKFFCRIKGSIYAQSNGRQLLILFMHSLKIIFASSEQDLTKQYQ